MSAVRDAADYADYKAIRGVKFLLMRQCALCYGGACLEFEWICSRCLHLDGIFLLLDEKYILRPLLPPFVPSYAFHLDGLGTLQPPKEKP